MNDPSPITPHEIASWSDSELILEWIKAVWDEDEVRIKVLKGARKSREFDRD